MPTITLPDGSVREYDAPVTVADVAESIGAGLARAALAGKLGTQLVDMTHTLTENTDLAIITARDPEGLDILRHSTAHLLAQAVKQLFPEAQITIGPVIEDGFYYDFAYERAFTLEDLDKIEQRMRKLAKQKIPIQRQLKTRDEAIAYFKSIGEHYKVEVIEAIPETEALSLYEQGDFIDLCRGPHVTHTGQLQVFKLTKLSGAYWRGDANNEMLQRIYGTAWANKKDLQNYLARLEEAKKRDHRKLAKTLDLFHLQEEAPGMVFWHPNGWAVWNVIERYMRTKQRENGYQEIRTPQVLDRTLWERSGHWEKFRDDMFTTESEKRTFAIKPMSCPGHIQIFNQGLKSYRDLPLRFAEFGCCHRNEVSGALHGLMRVRSMVQDDAHIFCTPKQIGSEAGKFIEQLYAIYRDFGFDTILVKLATRPELRIGSDAIWNRAEHFLKQALDEKQIEWELNPGEGAFYGPKIEFSLKDCLGRVWQCGTLQVDFSMPERLGASYIAKDGSRQVPVMLHRAVLGTFERFIGILIEHYAGKFPPWLAPVQVVVMTISDAQADYAHSVTEELKKKGYRAKLDLRNEKIGFKIREHTLHRIPYLLVIGDRECSERKVAVRTRSGEDWGGMSLMDFVERLQEAVAEKGRFSCDGTLVLED